MNTVLYIILEAQNEYVNTYFPPRVMNVLRCLTVIAKDESAHAAIVVEPVHHGCERGCIESVI